MVTRARKGLLTLVALAALACDTDASGGGEPSAEIADVCPELVAKVKEQCGEDSPAYKKQKKVYLDAVPSGPPQSDEDAAMRARRLRACQAGLATANEKLDYSVVPNFTVGNDAEMSEHAVQAKQHWEARKAAYEKMTPEEKAKDEAAQLEQRCMLWILG